VKSHCLESDVPYLSSQLLDALDTGSEEPLFGELCPLPQ